MKLIVGLGNPGKQYQKSRHNVGFSVVDLLAQQWSIDLTKKKYQACFGSGHHAGRPLALLKPQTFMNCSGASVAQAVAFYQLPPEDLLVICDDMALPLGQIRLRAKGSAGGHNGLKDIIEKLGHYDFPRLKLGIGPAQPSRATEHVLGQFTSLEKPDIEDAIKRTADAAQCWSNLGIEDAMNQYNTQTDSQKNTGSDPDKQKKTVSRRQKHEDHDQ